MPRPDRQSCTVATALDLILGQVAPLVPRSMPLADALGCVAGERILASTDQPPVPTAAMDGFAVRVADLTTASPAHRVELTIAGTVAAGQSESTSLGTGHCLRIMTGAICPPGADGIVPWEQVQESAGSITFSAPVPAGQHIRFPGEVQRRGSELIASGTQLTPAHLGLLASNGLAAVQAHPRPRVAVVTIGDELIEPGHSTDQGTLPDSNSVAIPAMIWQFGGEIVAQYRVGDTIEAVIEALEQVASAAPDLIVTVGGASSSERDILGQLDAPVVYLQSLDVQMRPGRPLVCGTVLGLPLIGLPGNPGAAMISAWQFVRPAVRKCAGLAEFKLPSIRLPAQDPLLDAVGRRSFVRARLLLVDGEVWVASAGSQSPANQLSMAITDALIVLDETTASIAQGDLVPVQILAPDRYLALLASAVSPPIT